MNDADPRLVLARRLRALREDQWPDLKITQAQLAQALGGKKPLSVPLISSWETQASPKIPPLSRLDAYAALFATRRSFTGDVPQPIEAADMTDAERQAMAEIKRELTQMRAQAMGATAVIGPEGYTGPEADRLSGLAASLNSGLWRFADGDTVTVVCAQFPERFRAVEKYTDRNSPDYIELYTYSELDALFELYGHLRAANPVNQIDLRLAEGLARDVYSSHLITLGGIDWNATTSSVLNRLKLPVRQVADWGEENPEDDDVYFDITEKGGRKAQCRPEYTHIDGRRELVSDVALFVRARNPFNSERTVTICSGMYGRGTYGVVRALTDVRFRDRNGEYLRDRFGSSDCYCILTRVEVVDGATLTPDWKVAGTVLFEWSGDNDDRD